MIYRFRIILDVKEDVLRDIEIDENATFEDLHHAITQAFPGSTPRRSGT